MVTESAGIKGELEATATSSSRSGASASAPMTLRAQAQSEIDNGMRLEAAVCTNDANFLPNTTDVEDVEIKKPSTRDKLITARTRA